MKTFLWLGFGLALLAAPLSAQTTPAASAVTSPDGTTPAPKHHHHPRFLTQLNLTAEQEKQIEQIRHGSASGREKHVAVEKVLTPAQRAQLKQLRAQWKAQHSNA